MASTSQGFGHSLPLVCQREESRVVALRNTHMFNNSSVHKAQTQESESSSFLPASPSSRSIKKDSKISCSYNSTNTPQQPVVGTEVLKPHA